MEDRDRQMEEAILQALKMDIALVRNDLEVFVMKKDGSKELLCRSENYLKLWDEAKEALSKLDASK